MSSFAKKIFRTALLIICLSANAHQAYPESTDSLPHPEPIDPVTVAPELSEIIPLASMLPGRLALLEAARKNIQDLSDVEKKHTELNADIDAIASQLETIKRSGRYNWVKLDTLARQLRYHKIQYEENGKQLATAINQFADWKKEWQTKHDQWRNWESLLAKDLVPSELKSTFNMANDTIETALGLITQQLDTLLLVQQKGGAVRTRIDTLESAIQSMISESRKSDLLAEWPALLSSEYFTQLRGGLWREALENLGAITWPDRRYFAPLHWLFVTQFLSILIVFFTIHRSREAFSKTKHWNFLAARPVSAALFVGILSQFLFPTSFEIPILLKLLYSLVGWFSSIRLLGVVIEKPWQRQAGFGILTFFVLTMILEAFNFPLPLYRLYIFTASLLAFFVCLRWVSESERDNDNLFFVWTLRLASLFFVVIVALQLFGTKGTAVFQFKSLLASLAIILTFTLFIKILRGGLHWLFFSSPVWKIKQLRSGANDLARKTGFLVEFTVWITVLPIILTVWGIYDNVPEATACLLNLGFEAGSARISFGLVLLSAGILYSSFLFSWIFPKLLLDEKVAGQGMERGARISIGRLIQYFIIFIGFLWALTALGFDFTKITIILSALGVGIGFGLQGIVNNVISGLILLFEQPIRVGDTIEIDGKWSEIKRIGLRSTTVQTLDQADVIIANADLINNQVINWTLSNRQIRITVPVGIAYGSNIQLAFETLLECARENKLITNSPPPQVLFLAFGDSSLGLELRVWITDADHRLRVISDLHREIEKKFREAKIEIAFPQRDLHLRSIDSSIVVPSRSKDEQERTS